MGVRIGVGAEVGHGGGPAVKVDRLDDAALPPLVLVRVRVGVRVRARVRVRVRARVRVRVRASEYGRNMGVISSGQACHAMIAPPSATRPCGAQPTLVGLGLRLGLRLGFGFGFGFGFGLG